MRIKFINATIVTVRVLLSTMPKFDEFEIYENGMLVVEDNIITYAGKQGDYSIEKHGPFIEDGKAVSKIIKYLEDSDFDKIIDCQGNILMPGLINTHCHAAMSFLRGRAEGSDFNTWWYEQVRPIEQTMTDADYYKGVKIAAQEMMQNGITTFFDVYMNYEQTIKAVSELGMRVGIGFGVISDTDTTTMEKLEKELNFLKSQNNVYPLIYTHSVYSCDEHQFGTLIQFAKKHNLVFCTHASETLKEVGECHNKYGVTPIGLLEKYGVFDVRCVLAHLVHCDIDDAEIMGRHDVTCSHNPSSNLKLACGIAPITTYKKYGINIALGTDGAASNNSLNLFKEMYLAGMLQAGVLNDASAFTAQELIKMATINGARAYKINNLGALQEGYLADIIMLDSSLPNMQPNNNVVSNIVYSAGPQNVIMTMIDGKIVYNPKNL